MKLTEQFLAEMQPGVEVPATALVQFHVNVPSLILLNKKHSEAREFTSIQCALDGTTKFFLEGVYRAIWSTIDSFGNEEGDPRLSPLLDLLDIIQGVESKI